MTHLALAERIQQLDGALVDVPHAFGGALALAYYAEPRATVDIDLNVFVPVDDYGSVADRLVGLGIPAGDEEVRRVIACDGQGRVMWDDVPVDLFLSYDAFHEAAEGATRMVPFASRQIPVLSPEHLMVCKVVFDRPRDWVDIEAILAAGTVVDAAEVLRWVARIAGDGDGRYSRAVATLLRR